jgi:hypothetical protein
MRKLSKTSGVTEYFPDLGPPQRAQFKPMWGPRDQQQRWGKYPGRQIGSIVHGALAVASGLSARRLEEHSWAPVGITVIQSASSRHTHAMWECNGSNGRHISDECDRRSAWQCESCGDRGAGRGGGKACARTGRPTCFASRGRAALWCPPMLCSDAALHRRLSGCLVRSRPRVCFGCGLSQGAEGKDA